MTEHTDSDRLVAMEAVANALAQEVAALRKQLVRDQRFEAAKAAMQGILSGAVPLDKERTITPELLADYSVIFGDCLLAELAKKGGTK